MKDNKTTVSGGVGFTGLLQVVFITLKLMGIINWSWLWVLSPAWITIAIYVLLFVIVAIWYH